MTACSFVKGAHDASPVLLVPRELEEALLYGVGEYDLVCGLDDGWLLELHPESNSWCVLMATSFCSTSRFSFNKTN
jgi:hypothetical protein